MKIKNVIFDLGAVLLEWNPEKIISRAFRNKDDQERAKIGILDHSDWIDMDRGTLTENTALEMFASRTGIPESSIKNFFDVVRSSLTLKNDTLKLLVKCKQHNLKLFCLSNMSMDNYEFVRDRYDFFRNFSGIVISGDIQKVKPDPEVFEYILSKYRLFPSETIFIDDNANNVRVAESFGIHGIKFDDALSCEKTVFAIIR